MIILLILVSLYAVVLTAAYIGNRISFRELLVLASKANEDSQTMLVLCGRLIHERDNAINALRQVHSITVH